MPISKKLLLTIISSAFILLGGCGVNEDAGPLSLAFGVLDRSNLSRAQNKRLARAETDFNRTLDAKNPRYAFPGIFITDGGTQIYYGDGYELTSFRRMTKQDGIEGYLIGPCITLDHKITGSAPISHTQTTFVTKENLPPRP
jgi:hypothetical protein